ncbi:MAG: HAMP domain-containing histidine kinase [Acidobacteria bacterium]|nr:HAMP domain-containing histidine kinase [Acidobacteriota bacterium]
MWRRLSLLSKIWLSTSVALTALFGITGVLLQRKILETATETLRQEAEASFQSYQSLWKARSETLGSVAAIMSSMPNVRAAFQTGHRPTIRDAASELWDRASDQLKETAFFVVADPAGTTLAALDAHSPVNLPSSWAMMRSVREQFPAQASGFAVINNQLFQLVLTPVYVDGVVGRQLMSVLITGYVVNHLVAQRLKDSTGGSEFLFLTGDRVFASTLNERATSTLVNSLAGIKTGGLVSDGVSEYASLVQELVDLEGHPAGALFVFRSFDSARKRLAELQRYLIVIWIGALGAGLLVSYLLARRIVQPVRMLDQAAGQVARQNYTLRIPDAGEDELGRLAATFNSMCESLQGAQQELIRQERISTIGRMASSIVHDLRNPLAAIYGGAEMMVDTDLSPAQVKRVAANIYKSSRRIQEMLQDLLQVTRGKSGIREVCQLYDVVAAAVEANHDVAAGHGVKIETSIPDGIELSLERARVERVFLNLIGNAIEMMEGGGEIRIAAREQEGSVEIDVSDTGPGIAPEIRDRLFQPFASFGKRNGLGLGLALSRQSILDHGGDMWVTGSGPGANFRIRLPRAASTPAMAAQ